MLQEFFMRLLAKPLAKIMFYNMRFATGKRGKKKCELHVEMLKITKIPVFLSKLLRHLPYSK